MNPKKVDMMDANAWQVYQGNRWEGFLPLITLWHVFQSLARTITLAELNLLIASDGITIDCGKAGKWIPWKYVVLSPEFLKDLREICTLQAMEKDGVLERHRRGCFRVEGSDGIFMIGEPYYRKVPKGYQPEMRDGEPVFDPKFEAQAVVVNTQSQIGCYIIRTKEWPMTRSVAHANQLARRPVHQARSARPVRQGPQQFFVKRSHESVGLLQSGVTMTREAVLDLEKTFA